MLTELSIIIPALNEADYLPRLLTSIANQKSYKGKLEVIVVDGQSDDGTARIARSFKDRIPGLQVIEAARRDIGYQRNRGAERAACHYLLFLDADTILPPNALQGWAKRTKLSTPFIAVALHEADRMDFFDYCFLVVGYFLCLVAWICRVPMVNGDWILTTKENHQRISGFVEGALLGEDADYGIRSVKAGAAYRFYISPRIIGSDRRVREMGRAKLLFLWARAFIEVRRHGPIFAGNGYEYRFGHYGIGKRPKN